MFSKHAPPRVRTAVLAKTDQGPRDLLRHAEDVALGDVVASLQTSWAVLVCLF